MKTENFDDAIRRKVESINQSYEDKDIDRIHEYVDENKVPVSLWETYGSTFMVPFLGIFIAGLLFWNYRQVQEQKTLLGRIDKLQNELAEANVNRSSPAARDTVLIVKYIDGNGVGLAKDGSHSTAEDRTGSESNNIHDNSGALSASLSPLPPGQPDIQQEGTLLQGREYGGENDNDNSSYGGSLASANQLTGKENSTQPAIEKEGNDNNSLSEPEIVVAKANASADLTGNERPVAANSRENGNNKQRKNNKLANEENLVNNKLAPIKEETTSDDLIKTEEAAIGKNAGIQRKGANNSNLPENTETTGNYVALSKTSKSKPLDLVDNKSTSKITSTADKRRKKERLSKSSGDIQSGNNDEEPSDKIKEGNNKDTEKLSGFVKAANKEQDSLAPVVHLKDLEFKDSVLVASDKPKKKKRSFSLKNLQYQAGVGIEKTNCQFGFGVLGEVFLNKRFSFSLGVKMLSVNNERYNNDNEFDNHRNIDFKYKYVPSYIPDTSIISNINIRYQLIQLPIALTYYQPLSRTFSLSFSVGTDLDLYTYQNLRYDHRDREYIAPPKNENLDLKNPTVMFNNVVLAVGVQKQWNHFVLQASPFVSPQTRMVEYKRESLYYGLRLRAMYKF